MSVRSYFAKKYEKVLDSLLAAEVEAASETPSLSNKELIQNIASSLLNASIEKYKRDKGPDDDSFSDQTAESVDEFWKDENFKQENEPDTPPSTTALTSTSSPVAENVLISTEKKSKEHFFDIFIDKMVSKMAPERLPEREQFAERIVSPEMEKKGQVVSASIIRKNLASMGGNMSGIFDFQESVIRLLTWRNPSGTITLLIIFTFICKHPIILILFPLLHLMYGIMIPAYLHRHPLRRTIYPTRRRYGRSLLEDLTSGGPSNAWDPKGAIYEFDKKGGKSNNSSADNTHGMEVVIGIRDFQNMTSSIASMNKTLEKFKYGVAGFKDERHSTLFFFIAFSCVIILALLSPYIPWSNMICTTAWVTMTAIHPHIRPKLKHILDRINIQETKSSIEYTERYDVILDEPPEVRYVEMFEIYAQGVTPQHWNFYKFSTSVFDPQDQYRKLQRPPPGADSLDEVQPPRTWSFDNNSQWELDAEVGKWSSERGLSLHCEGDFLCDEFFKRRRWTRRVVRYANPARKPSNK